MNESIIILWGITACVKTMKKLFFIITNLQIHYHFKLNFQKVDQHPCYMRTPLLYVGSTYIYYQFVCICVFLSNITDIPLEYSLELRQ